MQVSTETSREITLAKTLDFASNPDCKAFSGLEVERCKLLSWVCDINPSQLFCLVLKIGSTIKGIAGGGEPAGLCPSDVEGATHSAIGRDLTAKSRGEFKQLPDPKNVGDEEGGLEIATQLLQRIPVRRSLPLSIRGPLLLLRQLQDIVEEVSDLFGRVGIKTPTANLPGHLIKPLLQEEGCVAKMLD